MPFNVSDFTSQSASWFCRSKALDCVASNTIYVAIILTTLVFIIFLIAYNNVSISEAGRPKSVKTFVYVLLSVSSVLFLHHYAHVRCIQQMYANKPTDQVFDSIYHNPITGGGPEMTPITSLPAVPIAPAPQSLVDLTNDDLLKTFNT
jgi:hypothetical protein